MSIQQIFNQAFQYQQQGDFFQAETLYQGLLDGYPRMWSIWYNLGLVYRQQGRISEAENAYRQAMALEPGVTQPTYNLANLLKDQGQLEEAEKLYRRVLQLEPDHGEAHMNLGLILLTLGRYEEGWPEYAWRFQQHPFYANRQFPIPRWQGEPLSGKRLLVVQEQGFGDTLQCLRYLAWLKKQGATILLEGRTELTRLLHHYPGIDDWRDSGQAILSDEADYYVYLMDLPTQCGTTWDSIPSLEVPLTIQEEWRIRWGNNLKDLPGHKIGLVWSGSDTNPYNQTRACPLSAFSPLAQLPHVTLVSLQKGPAESELETVSFPIVPLGGMLKDFADTAAVIESLDLIITVDTAVAHLAGCLEKPTWLLLPRVPDWRWGLSVETTPWYPSMWLFRQTQGDQWELVFQKMEQALLHFSGS